MYCGIVLLMNVTVTLNRGCSLVSVKCETKPYRKCRKSQHLDPVIFSLTSSTNCPQLPLPSIAEKVTQKITCRTTVTTGCLSHLELTASQAPI